MMDLINDGTEDVTVDLMFNFPDQLIGYDLLTPVATNGYIINNEGTAVASGNITVTAWDCESVSSCAELKSTPAVAGNLEDEWKLYILI